MSKLKVIWKRNLDQEILDLACAKKAEICVVGTEDSSIYSLDKIGKTLWDIKIKGKITGLGITGDARFTFVSSSLGIISCIDKNGYETWEYKTEDALTCIHNSDKGNMIVAGSLTGNFYNLNNQGEIRFSKNLKESIDRIAISNDQTVSLCTTSDNNIYAIDDVGEILCKKTLDFSCTDMVLAPSGDFFAISAEDGKIHVFDLKGNKKWDKEIEGTVSSIDIPEKTKDIIVVVNENMIYYLKDQGQIGRKQNLDYHIRKFAASSHGENLACITSDSLVIYLENLEDDTEVFYEILCRGSAKCGTFVSAVYTESCPKCGSQRNVVRIIREKL